MSHFPEFSMQWREIRLTLRLHYSGTERKRAIPMVSSFTTCWSRRSGVQKIECPSYWDINGSREEDAIKLCGLLVSLCFFPSRAFSLWRFMINFIFPLKGTCMRDKKKTVQLTWLCPHSIISPSRSHLSSLDAPSHLRHFKPGQQEWKAVPWCYHTVDLNQAVC